MRTSSNYLKEYFFNNQDRLINKWVHYFEVYERYLGKFYKKDVVILEIGVAQGGSLQMWKNYFGPGTKVFGIDIDSRCKNFEEENVQVFIGSQSNKKFLRQVRSSIPPVDIIIDDGGHRMKQQRVAFEELFGHLKEDGIYICEDIMTSYWLRFGGGYKRQNTFIEFSKNFVDYIHAHHSQQVSLKPNKFTKSINSIHFYEGIVVIEKKRRKPLESKKIGVRSFDPKQNNFKPRIVYECLYVCVYAINVVLRTFRLPSIIWK